ncbi:MAG: 50S ribosomal protein L11 methyltransferase [Eubacterium sp.]|nr:50S ribosomal protein L11 methyltransferase [Eubacterium sp.]
MKWKKYTIETTVEAEDYISAMLDELGVEGIEIEDNVPLSKEDQTKMFIDFLPELPANDGTSRVSFYLDFDKDNSALIEDIKKGIDEQRIFVEVGKGTITESETEDIDWMNNWKQYFHSFTIEDILIKPTWEDIKKEDEDKILIEIDPGTAFGTGKHETTQLCIKALTKYIKPGMEVLDVGFGSGILSIVALKKGASHVTGTDLDEICINSVAENFEVNSIPEDKGSFYVGNLIDDEKLQKTVGEDKYDIVLANILADVIIPLSPVIPARLKKGGIYIVSGIIDFKENEVVDAMKNAGFEILSVEHQGEWVGIVGKNK